MMFKILSILSVFFFVISFNIYSAEVNTGEQNNNLTAVTDNSNSSQNVNSRDNISYADQQKWKKVNSDLHQIKNKKDFSAMKKTMNSYFYSHHGNILVDNRKNTSREQVLQNLESFKVVSGSPWKILLTIVGKWDPYYNVSINSNYNDNDFWAFFITGDFERFDYYQQADAKRVYAQWHVVTFYPLIIAIKYPKNPYSIVYSVQIRDYLTYFAMYLKNITQNEKGNLDVYDADIVLARDKF
ncbi:MAG TPA: hypothetical protein QF753_15790 [Victivallales bacterium]|nr:hypothetical protein [Victivallales bacterium]